jgi:tetratricopeptide (TPR) repeat protein
VRLVPQGVIWVAEPRPEALDIADQRFAEGRWWEAAYHYGAVLGNAGSADREYPESLARWAVALERSGYPELADAVTTRYLTVAGEPGRAQQVLGELYFTAGAHERAATHLTQSLAAIGPNTAAKAYLEGRIAEARGDRKAARSAYERCLKIDPNHSEAQAQLGRLRAE